MKKRLVIGMSGASGAPLGSGTFTTDEKTGSLGNASGDDRGSKHRLPIES